MSDEALEALLGGENLTMGDLTGVPDVDEDAVVEQLEPEKVEEEEPEEEEVETLDSFLAALQAVDIDADAAYGLEVSMQDASGNKTIKTVGELKDEYVRAQQVNLESSVTTRELETRKAELDAQQETFRTMQTDLLNMPNEIAEVESKIVAMDQYIQQNGEDLKVSNPGQLNLATQELMALKFTRDNLQTVQYNQRESLQNAIRDAEQIRRIQHKEQQTEAMMQLIPEWSDPVVMGEEQKALIDYAVSEGFPLERVMAIDDPITIQHLNNSARQARKMADIKETTKAPKPLKPQAVKTKTTADRAAFNKLIKEATDSKDPRHKTDAVVALMSQ